MMDRLCIILVVVFAVTGFAELVLASESCDLECVLGRLADVEQKQRESEAENKELRRIVSEQQSMLDAQADRIHKLEETLEHAQHPATKKDDDSLGQDDGDKRILTSVNKLSYHWQKRHIPTGNVIKQRGKRQERAGIAFSAYLDHNADLNSHQTIKFNKIILNEGNAYNIHTGVFTCPSSGVYLLTFSIGGSSSHFLSATLVKNSEEVVDAIADSMHATQELQGGNTIMIRLDANDVVWLEAFETNSHVKGSSTLRLSTFSGVLLYP